MNQQDTYYAILIVVSCLSGLVTYLKLKRLERIGEKLMAKQEDVDAVLAKIDAATNKMATALTGIVTKVDALKEQIKNMGLTADQEAALLTKLDAVAATAAAQADVATGIAADPADPVPTP